MKKMLLAAFACVLVCGSAVSQTKPPDPEEFFTRLNALDDWFITMDGKEDNKAVVDRFMELFNPDAYLQVGPSKNQLGGVTYHGVEGIRKWADQFSRSYLDLNYRISFKTREEKTAKPVYTFQMPWGEQGAAVEFTAVYTNRTDRNRFWMPGAAFFMFDKDGKITELRIYMLRDEAEQTKTYVAM
jgi:SnoaL-like domain